MFDNPSFTFEQTDKNIQILKGLSVIVRPQIFWHIQRELDCDKLPVQQFSRNSLYLQR